jgi:hypothetical protein
VRILFKIGNQEPFGLRVKNTKKSNVVNFNVYQPEIKVQFQTEKPGGLKDLP